MATKFDNEEYQQNRRVVEVCSKNECNSTLSWHFYFVGSIKPAGTFSILGSVLSLLFCCHFYFVDWFDKKI